MEELSRQALVENIQVMKQAIHQIETMQALAKCLMDMSKYFHLFSEVSLKTTVEHLQNKVNELDQVQIAIAANDR